MAAKPTGSYQILNQFWGVTTVDGEEIWLNRGGLNGFELLYTASQTDEILALKASIEYVDTKVLAETNRAIAVENTKANSADIVTDTVIAFGDPNLVGNVYTDLSLADQIVQVAYTDENGSHLTWVVFNSLGVGTLPAIPISGNIQSNLTIRGNTGVLADYVKVGDVLNFYETDYLPAQRPTGITSPLAINNASFFIELATSFLKGIDVLKEVYAYAANTTSFKIGFFTISGSNFVKLAEKSFTPTVGLNTYTENDFSGIDLTFPSLADGERVYIGVKSTASAMSYNRLGVSSSSIAVPDASSGVISSTANYEISAYIQTYRTTPIQDVTDALDLKIDALEVDLDARLDVNEAYIEGMNLLKEGTVYTPENRGSSLPSGSTISTTLSFFLEYATYIDSLNPFHIINLITNAATRNFTIGFFTLDGDNFEKIAEKSVTAPLSGLNVLDDSYFDGIDLTFPSVIGVGGKVYIGVKQTTATSFSFNSLGEAQSSFAILASAGTSGVIASKSNFKFSFYLQSKNYPESELVRRVNSISASGGRIDLDTVPVIVRVGDSYTAGAYGLKGKNEVNILSQFTDWNFDNYGQSGKSYSELITLLRANTPFYEDFPPRNYKWKYAILASFTNDVTEGSVNTTTFLEVYLDYLRTMCRMVKSLGAIPIICSEWVDIQGFATLFCTSASIVAQEEGAIFVDMLYKSNQLQGNRNTVFYGSDHPGTRTNSLIWKPLLKMIEEQLPRPMSSLKIFNKRSEVSVSTISDLFYTSNIQRNKFFKEIQVAEQRMATAQYSYYDDLPAWIATGTRLTEIESEYLKLRKGENVGILDYSLIECVLPVTELSSLVLFITSTDATVYYKNVFTDAWDLLTNTGGEITLTSSALTRCLDYDKIAFLVYKSGGFTMDDVYVEYVGSEEKNINAYKRITPVEFQTTELLAVQKVDTLTGWSVTGTLTPTTDLYNSLPSGITNYVELTTANFLKQSISFTSSTIKRKIQIKAWVRRFPVKHNPAVTPIGDNGITEDSYDFATLETSIYYDVKNCSFNESVVPLFNDEILIEADLPPNISTLTIGFRSLDKTIQFMYASVKIN